MSGYLYQPIYFITIGLICYLTSARFALSGGYSLQANTGKSQTVPLILCVLVVFFLGFRPVSPAFGDMATYAYTYEHNISLNAEYFSQFDREWAWEFLGVVCKSLGLGVHLYFTIIEAIYVFAVFWAVKKFFPTHLLVGTLFVLSSLMFFSFGVNGLRNGIACHLVLLAIAYFLESRYIISLFIAVIALGFHLSVLLPVVALLGASLVFRNFYMALVIWVICIIVSLVVGNLFGELLATFGLDDRLAVYSQSEEYKDLFSITGYRWDFLIYSAPPVVLGWYILIKKKIVDDWYRILCITYCLCNAFWILINRNAFSNRFAYLSWFLYPVVVAYPLLNMPVKRSQDRTIGVVLAIYCTFTLFIVGVVWGFQQ